MRKPENKHNLHFLTNRRRELRHTSTPQERIFWARVRGKKFGCKFYRQYSIGPYIVDFYCPVKKLIVELDGSQHLENQEYDFERTKYFNYLGYTVMRFWNNEVNINIEGVLTKVFKFLE